MNAQNVSSINSLCTCPNTFVVIRVCLELAKPHTKMAGSYSWQMQRRLYKEYERLPVKRGSEALGNLIQKVKWKKRFLPSCYLRYTIYSRWANFYPRRFDHTKTSLFFTMTVLNCKTKHWIQTGYMYLTSVSQQIIISKDSNIPKDFKCWSSISSKEYFHKSKMFYAFTDTNQVMWNGLWNWMLHDNRDISYLIVTLNRFAWRSIHTFILVY